MTIRDSINRLLGGGDEVPDTGRAGRARVASFGEGPMMVASLCEAGFLATGAPTFNVVTDVASDYRILVPRHQVVAATAHLDATR